MLNFGWFFLLFGAFVIVGAGNAVNLTDGLDGLAIVPVMIATASFGLIAYLVGNAVFSDYLQINMSPAPVNCGALRRRVWRGPRLPLVQRAAASIFMGDTGSLALGGMLGAIAVAVKHEIVLAVIGGLFVLETVSVIVQVASFKLTGKRVFRMAPIHHHFEQLGWTEPQIVIRFWIISVMLALAGLSTRSCGDRDDPRHLLRGQDGRGVRPRRVGLASCHALKAAARSLPATTTPTTSPRPRKPGFITADLRKVRGRISPRWC